MLCDAAKYSKKQWSGDAAYSVSTGDWRVVIQDGRVVKYIYIHIVDLFAAQNHSIQVFSCTIWIRHFTFSAFVFSSLSMFGWLQFIKSIFLLVISQVSMLVCFFRWDIFNLRYSLIIYTAVEIILSLTTA